MKNRQFLLLLIISVSGFITILSACRKVNDATSLGSGLIPVVDNVTTFDTIIEVETYNGVFDLLNDSTRLEPQDYHWFGRISNDPIFGATDADLYLELKPTFYPFAFRNINPGLAQDSLFIDSAVLVLDYVETYGDTLVPQTVEVTEITSEFKYDSNYLVNRNTLFTGRTLGSKTFTPSQLNDSIKVYLDTTKNQLRIPLNSSFGQELLDYDSVAGQPYSKDSAFKAKFRGFALKSIGGGNAIMGFNVTGANTKLAIYYRYQKGGPGIANQDTTVTYFNFTVQSAVATHIRRIHSAPVISASGPAADPVLYIQASPGTFATIKIPGFSTISNKIVHRAELIMEQIYDISDSTYPSPGQLYVDAYDDSLSKFRTIPYDLQLDGDNRLMASFFGGVPYFKTDPFGNPIREWRFNISRYFQHVLTKTLRPYDLRVYAPYYVLEAFGLPRITEDVIRAVTANNAVARGRVRLHGGDLTGTNPQRMRIRLIYSKI